MNIKTQKFHYCGQLESKYSPIFMTHGSYWEWDNYRLLHPHTGEEILVDGIPYLSPNRQYFFSTKNVSLYEMEGVSIQLWEITPTGFDLIWELVPAGYYIPRHFAWIDNKTVVFEAVHSFENEGKLYGKIQLP